MRPLRAESDAWKAQAAARKSWRDYFREVGANWKRFLYLVMLMAMMNFMSHGTQDLYPTFLQNQRHFSTRSTALISAISMVGAIAGGILVGLYSDRRGRRRAMVTAALCALLLIPVWVFAPPVIALIVGGRVPDAVHRAGRMGVIPAHINELSPGQLRGFSPASPISSAS